MRAAVKVCVFAFLFCCKSGGADRFHKIAQRANPVIERMRGPVGVVLDPAQADAKVIRTACLAAIADAAALSSAGFKDSFVGTAKRTDDSVTLGVDDVLYTFSMQKDLMCREDQGDGSRDARCRRWCVEMFTDLADAVARAKEAAAKEGVTLQALRP